MMANTTLPEIQNEIKGQDDTIVTEDTEKDFIRRLTFENVKVEFIKKSNEVENKLHRRGLIVVTKNETANAGPNQLSVTRYWQNVYTNWIESEYLFDVQNGPYDDIFVFDKYAVVIKDKKLVNAVYFDKFRGGTVPFNFEMPLYDDLQFTQNTFAKITFWDYTGKGNWKMFGAIQTMGAVTIYKFDMDINYEGGQGVISQQRGNGQSLFANTVITSFETSRDLLVLGCPTCNEFGIVAMYVAQTLKPFKSYSGNKGYEYFGNQILPVANTGGAQQFWISSRKGTTAHFNSVTATNNFKTE